MFMSQVTFFIPTTCMIIHVWIWVMSWMKYGHYIINNWFICIWYISQIQYKNYFRCIILFWNCQKWPEQLLYQKIIMSQFDISHVCRCRLQAIFVLYVGGNMFFFCGLLIIDIECGYFMFHIYLIFLTSYLEHRFIC